MDGVNWYEINRQIVDGDTASVRKGYDHFRREAGIAEGCIERD